MMTRMAKTKAPAARGFTLAERRSLQFEQVSLYMVFLVAVIAAVISFFALVAVGKEAGLGYAAYLLPVAIDGFGIACSVGIVRSVASGDRFLSRVSEWIGLLGALGLSILGNVHHSLAVGSASLPDYVKIAYATAVPVIVAYGIHVYGNAMSRGLSAHVLADEPDKLHFDVAHLGDQDTVARAHAPAKVTRTPPASRAQATSSAPTPTRTESAPAARAARPAPTAEQTADQARMRGAFDAAVTANPHVKPVASHLARELGIEAHPATPRRWVAEWWAEHEAAMGTARPAPAGEPTPKVEEKVAADAPA